jgi:AbrB family looped-hinge helix DNA binding protein
MPKATLTSKGQVTIPKGVRDSLRLRAGDRVEFVLSGGDEAVMKPITRSVEEVFGRLHKPGRPVKSIEEMKQAVARRLKERRK